MIKFLPLVFILLWSSAFITTKPIVDNSDPFAALCFRFLIVAIGFYFFSLFSRQKKLFVTKNILPSISTGILFHGFYLGGVFYSISIGLPTGIAALIVTLQPVLTNALAGPILNEKITWEKWLGVLLGFVGAILVLGFDVGKSLPLQGIVAVVISLIAVTCATLWQKKISNNLPLSVSNMYQAIGGCLFHLIVIVLFVDPLYLHVILNKTNLQTAVILFIIPFFVVLSAYLLGRMKHVLSNKLWMIFMTLGYLCMAILHMYFGIALDYKILVPAFVLMGLAWGIINVVPAVMISENIHGDHIGVAIGALFSFFNIGAAAVLAFAVLLFHVRVFASLLAQFAQHNIALGAAAIHSLKQFVGQPDKMHHVANMLGINPARADNILRKAFVAGMGHMFLALIVLAVLACLLVATVMRRDC